MTNIKAWLGYEYHWREFVARVAGNASATTYQRTGYFEKENYQGNQSLGKSPRIYNYDYSTELSAGYEKGGRLNVVGHLKLMTISPEPSRLFFARDYRNTTTPSSIKEQIGEFDLTADLRTSGLRLHASIFYTTIRNKTELHSFYDDNIYCYTNYWIRGISQRHMGVEFSAEIPLSTTISFSGALIVSDNRYTSNPVATQWSDTNGKLLRSGEMIHYRDLHVSGSPQTIAIGSISYTPRWYRFTLSVNAFDNNYISVTPLRRTDRSRSKLSKYDQEKLTSGVTVDFFAGKNFRIARKHSLGVWIGINNILNKTNITVSGFESYRSVNSPASDSRYYHALGRNGFLTVTFTL